jgi:hypothetical protein
MAYRPPDPKSAEQSTAARDPDSPPDIPRWLKISGIVVIVLILVAVGLLLITGMEHGPGPVQHGPGSDAGSDPAAYARPTDGPPRLAVNGELASEA